MDNREERLTAMEKEDLIDLMVAYDLYVIQFFDDADYGNTPVCLMEFYDNEYQEILKERIEKESNMEISYRVKQDISEAELIEKYGFKKVGIEGKKYPYGSLEVKDKSGLGVSIWWADKYIQILLGESAEYGVAGLPPTLIQMIKDDIVEEYSPELDHEPEPEEELEKE